jgi:hypothetical protein
MNWCVGDTKHKYALDKPTVLEIWLIKVETNLTIDEIKSLEEVGFVLNKQRLIFPQSLFGGESSIPINRLVDEMLWPTSPNGKVVCRRVPSKMSNLHYNRWEAFNFLKATINPSLEVPLPRYGWIYKIMSGQNPNKKQYEVTIRNFLVYTYSNDL